jgi:DNA-binding transcriptional MerR regulator
MVGPERDRSETPQRPRPATRLAKSAAAFRTISEVADDLDVAQHVLRFWESKFPQVRPLKRGGGRRYYRPEDVDLLRQIRSLLYEEGYTIRGAQKLLKGHRRAPGDAEGENGTAEPVERPQAPTPLTARPAPDPRPSPELPLGGHALTPEVRDRLLDLRAELVSLRKLLHDVMG